MTLKEHLIKSLSWAVSLFAILALSMAYVWYVDTSMMVAGSHDDMMQIRDHAEHSPAAVYEANKDECWRGSDSPKAELPGSIIIQRESGKAVRITNPAKVHDAFAEALGYEDAPFRWIALCI